MRKFHEFVFVKQINIIDQLFQEELASKTDEIDASLKNMWEFLVKYIPEGGGSTAETNLLSSLKLVIQKWDKFKELDYIDDKSLYEDNRRIEFAKLAKGFENGIGSILHNKKMLAKLGQNPGDYHLAQDLVKNWNIFKNLVSTVWSDKAQGAGYTKPDISGLKVKSAPTTSTPTGPMPVWKGKITAYDKPTKTLTMTINGKEVKVNNFAIHLIEKTQSDKNPDKEIYSVNIISGKNKYQSSLSRLNIRRFKDEEGIKVTSPSSPGDKPTATPPTTTLEGKITNYNTNTGMITVETPAKDEDGKSIMYKGKDGKFIRKTRPITTKDFNIKFTQQAAGEMIKAEIMLVGKRFTDMMDQKRFEKIKKTIPEDRIDDQTIATAQSTKWAKEAPKPATPGTPGKYVAPAPTTGTKPPLTGSNRGSLANPWDRK